MPTIRVSRRREEDLNGALAPPTKRTKTASSGSGEAAPKTGLADLPVEILYLILILSGSSSLPVVNRRLHAAFTNTPTQVRAAFLISRLWHDITTGLIPALPRKGKSRAEEAALYPLYEPELHSTFNALWGRSMVTPPRLIDARDLVHQRDLTQIPWPKSGIEEPVDVDGIWRAQLRKTRPSPDASARGPLPPIAYTDPIRFALSFPICNSCAVLDAFSLFLHQIPTFKEVATRACIAGRMRTTVVPAGVVRRLVPRGATPGSAGPAAPSPPPSASESELYQLVSRLGQGPRPPEDALRLFLRALFWHHSSYYEMRVHDRRATEHVPAQSGAKTVPYLVANLRMHLNPYVPCGDPGPWTYSRPRDDGRDTTLIQAAADRNMWALRLARRFERIDIDIPRELIMGPVYDDPDDDPEHGGAPLGTLPLLVKGKSSSLFSSSSMDDEPTRDNAAQEVGAQEGNVVHYLILQGWLEGLRYAVKAETPDEAQLEAGVCNRIAKLLVAERIIAADDPFVRDWLEIGTGRRGGSGAAPNGASSSTFGPAVTPTAPSSVQPNAVAQEQPVTAAAAAAAAGPAPSSTATDTTAAPASTTHPQPSTTTTTTTTTTTATATTAPAPALPPLLKPVDLPYARPERILDAADLTLAVRAGQFEVVDYLMREHGLSPDLQTLRALERRRRKKQQQQRQQQQQQGATRRV